MNDRLVTVATTSMLVVFAAVGFIDAARDDNEGSAVLFALIAIGVLGLARSRSKSGSVVLRRDLASWLERTSSGTGETPDQLANRAVSRLRAGFTNGPHEEP